LIAYLLLAFLMLSLRLEVSPTTLLRALRVAWFQQRDLLAFICGPARSAPAKPLAHMALGFA